MAQGPDALPASDQDAASGAAAPAAPPAPEQAPAADAPAAGAPAGGAAPRRFIIFGHDGADWLSSTDVFYPGDGGGNGGAWAQLAPQPCARSFAGAAVLDATLFAVGGGDGEEWYDSVLRCAPALARPPRWPPGPPCARVCPARACGVEASTSAGRGASKESGAATQVNWTLIVLEGGGTAL